MPHILKRKSHYNNGGERVVAKVAAPMPALAPRHVCRWPQTLRRRLTGTEVDDGKVGVGGASTAQPWLADLNPEQLGSHLKVLEDL